MAGVGTTYEVCEARRFSADVAGRTFPADGAGRDISEVPATSVGPRLRLNRDRPHEEPPGGTVLT